MICASHEDLDSVRRAASALAVLPTDLKNDCLRRLADSIDGEASAVLSANVVDLERAAANGLSSAKIARLRLTLDSVRQMADGVRKVTDLPDPVGRITQSYRTDSGLEVRKLRCSIGVILMIYEARPNVTVDAFTLCFKSGNACLLKGGREAENSTRVLAELAERALVSCGLPSRAISLLTDLDRDSLRNLLKRREAIDLVIPRGGRELIEFVHEHSRIPTIQHFQGVCHIFVDRSADLDRSLDVCVTAKTSAPAACNAVETILIHQDVAATFAPRLVDRFVREGAEVRGDEAVVRFAPSAVPAGPDDWGREYLDLIVAVRVVVDLDAAIDHIQRHGSNHTEAILTRDEESARRFLERVSSSCTLVNASTRFNDGFQLGLGAEIGISTSKIHAYGPMGLEELTTQRYVVRGEYQTR
jgi:glutamate-5-semialdehyde dehydrogenase